MKLCLVLLTLVYFLVAGASAADAPLDARYLRTHAETRGFLLGRPVKARPTPDGKAVLFLRSGPRVAKLALFEFDPASGETRELLTPEKVLKGVEEKLSPEEKARRERQRVSVGGFTDYQLSEDGSQILLSLSGRLYIVTRPGGAIRELKTGAGTIVDPKFSPDGKSVSYVKDQDVFVYDLAADQERRVTTGGTERKTHGLAEFVAQEEMSRFSGYWWSPDSQFIVYEEADADGVEVWYVADPAKPERPPEPSFYPRPGKNNVSVRVGIVPVRGGDTVWIDWDHKKYEYLTQVRWNKNGPLTITVQNRLQNELVLLQVDPKTGKTTPLVTEKDAAWLDLHQEVPRWLAGGRGFLWVSEQPEGPQLERRKPDGQLDEVLVEASRGYRGLVSVEPKTGEVVYLQGPDRFRKEGGKLVRDRADPRETHLWVLGPEKGELTRRAVAESDGQCMATTNTTHSLFVVTCTTPNDLPRTTVYKKDGTRIGELISVAESPGFTPKVEFVKVGADPGFYAAIVWPRNFDPKKKYPVIVDVYGGPGHQVVVRAMRDWLLPQWLADQGFVVVAIDNRGTPNRGRDWERALYKKFGSVPLDDQVAALQALGQKYPQLDLDRVGIYGWSFGGYMSALAVLKRPDIYKAAVAGAPVTDWLDYDTHYTERYLGLPQDSPEAYKEASLLTYAADLKRPLLLIHGTADDNVYFRHTLKLADALFRAGREFDLLPLSGLTHMVPEPVVMERLYGRIARHFQEHLRKTGRAD